MRVLIINPGPTYNVAAQWGAKLEGLSQWAEGSFMGTSPQLDHPLYGRFEIRMVKSNTGRGLRVLLQSLTLLLRLRRTRRFDLVLAYDPLRSGMFGWLASRLHRCPLIVEVNGVYTSPYVYYDSPKLKAWFRTRLLRLVMGFTLTRAAGIKLLFSQQVAPFEGRLSRQIVRSFPNFVDATRFRNLEDRKEILCVGSPFFLKGMDVLIAAFKSISDEFPDWRLKLLGWFPDRGPIDRSIDGHARISVHRPVPAAEMPEHIGRCGIFVLPSRTEAMGRVLIEAMAAEKARIASRVDGIPTVVEDGVDGLLSAPGDSVELANCLAKLMRDEALRKRLGLAAAARFKRDFGLDFYLRDTRRLYEDVLHIGRR